MMWMIFRKRAELLGTTVFAAVMCNGISLTALPSVPFGSFLMFLLFLLTVQGVASEKFPL